MLISEIVKVDESSFSKAMDILSFWRFSHESPLESAFKIVQDYATEQDKNAICAKRLKRHASISLKLKRFSSMKLKNMQDIGGCRAILSTEKKVYQTLIVLKRRKEFRFNDGLFRIKDYIKKPKDDGYRGIHLIGKFNDLFGGSRSIEVQLRTKNQHYWATAIEIVDLFTQQSLKTNQGRREWKEFFIGVSEILSVIDNIHMFDKLEDRLQFEKLLEAAIKKPDLQQTISKVIDSCKNIGIIEKLNAFSRSLQVINDNAAQIPADGYALIKIEINKKVATLNAQVFESSQDQEASDAFVEAEKEATKKEMVVALVFTDAIGGIKEAYPNYFADSSQFIKYLVFIEEIHKRLSEGQSSFISLLRRIFK
ncbi:hypothetical protein WG68_11965 [Arsukibacterium ikkense]|uniref:RelA/SpoT domain-containing protein n=2 Tax=Arsukibacterium ikkense TaxID=336831 RepID=A0A0M2V3K5_9GAMM|nr:hypothetical protein WG68_11965 [Arsukibacterium ikkense]